MRRRFKYLVFVFIMLHQFAGAATPSTDSPVKSYAFEQVIIRGWTNVNSFQLDYHQDSYSPFIDTKDTLSELLKMAIPVQDIKAESSGMKNDFLELINASEHPFINISIQDRLSATLFNGSVINHQVFLSINGVTNLYSCFSEIEKDGFGNWLLNGKLNVKLSDFKITPPKKFMGLIKVEDEVFISFKILFSPNTKIAQN